MRPDDALRERVVPVAPVRGSDAPRITALITVFNEERWITEAVISLCRQTLSDIEILVIDDGSTDETPLRLAAIDDCRLKVLRCARIGRAAALVLGVKEARGAYVAILDADDVAYPERLEKQVAYLDAHPKVAWLGCGEERQDSRRSETALRLYPSENAAVRRMAARCIPYSHSSVVFRRSLLEEGLTYDPSVPYLIDFEFFLRVAERHDVANLPEVLVMRRLRQASYFQSQFNRRIQNRALARLSASAVRRLKLPMLYYLFSLARLFYDLFPDKLKRHVRARAGLRERFGDPT